MAQARCARAPGMSRTLTQFGVLAGGGGLLRDALLPTPCCPRTPAGRHRLNPKPRARVPPEGWNWILLPLWPEPLAFHPLGSPFSAIPRRSVGPNRQPKRPALSPTVGGGATILREAKNRGAAPTSVEASQRRCVEALRRGARWALRPLVIGPVACPPPPFIGACPLAPSMVPWGSNHVTRIIWVDIHTHTHTHLTLGIVSASSVEVPQRLSANRLGFRG